MTTIERNAYFNQYAKAKRRPQRANDSTGEYDDWDLYSASEHSSEQLKSAEQEYGRLRAGGDHGRFEPAFPGTQAGFHRRRDRRQIIQPGS